MIRAAQAEDIAPVRVLFGEYAEWVGDHICFPAFEREMAELPGLYAPPDGRLLIAFSDDRLAGCVALRKLDAGDLRDEAALRSPGIPPCRRGAIVSGANY